MRKISIITITLLLTALSAFAQNDISARYDSLANFAGENAKAYKGQEFYLKGLDKGSHSFGYAGFILNYKEDNDILNDPKNIYKPNDNYNSKYEDLVSRYFYVLDVIEHPKAKETEEYTDIYYLKLQELSSNDVVFFRYNVKSEFTFPFVVRGFIEKQKQLLHGKEYVVSDNVLKESRNVVTGSALKFETGEQWECVDVTIDNKLNEIALVLKNRKGIKTTIPYSYMKADTGMRKMFTAEEATTLTKKYNSNNFRRILQNKIRTGMTKDMTRLAWGEPVEIKKEGKTEEWIYPMGKLTFSGDKIVGS